MTLQNRRKLFWMEHTERKREDRWEWSQSEKKARTFGSLQAKVKFQLHSSVIVVPLISLLLDQRDLIALLWACFCLLCVAPASQSLGLNFDVESLPPGICCSFLKPLPPPLPSLLILVMPCIHYLIASRHWIGMLFTYSFLPLFIFKCIFGFVIEIRLWAS